MVGKINHGKNAFQTSESNSRKDGFNNEDFILTKYGHGGSGGPRLCRDCTGDFRCVHCNRSHRNLPYRTEHSVILVRDRWLLPRIHSFWDFYKAATDMLLNWSAPYLQTIEEKRHDH